MFAARNVTGCLKCEYGSIATAASPQCTACADLQANTYSNAERTTCVECPAGYYATTYNLNPADLPQTAAYFNSTGDYDGVILPWPTPLMCHRCPNQTFRQLGEAACTNVSGGFVIREQQVIVESDYTPLPGLVEDANTSIINSTDFLPRDAEGNVNASEYPYGDAPYTRRLYAQRDRFRERLQSMSLEELEATFVTPRLQQVQERRHRRLQEGSVSDDPTYPPVVLLPCKKGYYSAIPGAGQCLPCPKGSYADQVRPCAYLHRTFN